MPASYWEEAYQFSDGEIAILSELQEELTCRKIRDKPIEEPPKQPLTTEQLIHYNLPPETGIMDFIHFYQWKREMKLKNLLSKDENEQFQNLKCSIDYKEKRLELFKTLQTSLSTLKEAKLKMKQTLIDIERDISKKEREKSHLQSMESKDRQRKECIKDWKEINDNLSFKIEMILSEEYLIYIQKALSNYEFISNHSEFEEYSLFTLRYRETLSKACERIKETLLLDWSLNSFNSDLVKDEKDIKEMSAFHLAKCKGPLLPFIKVLRSYSINDNLDKDYGEARLESLNKLALPIQGKNTIISDYDDSNLSPNSNMNSHSSDKIDKTEINSPTNNNEKENYENSNNFNFNLDHLITRISDICQVLFSESKAYEIIFQNEKFEMISEKWLYHWLPVIRLSINKINSKRLLEFLQELSLSFPQGIQRRMINVLLEYTKMI